jgi:hypothetical protein
MPAMPEGAVPLDIMLSFEAAFRTADTEVSLMSDVNTMMETSLHDYWKDWLLILAWHRAGKLELNDAKTRLMSKVSFVGFKLFDK